MQYHFFTIPIKNTEAAQDELNAFLRSRKVLSVQKELVLQGDNSFWVLAVEYLEGGNSPSKSVAKRNRIDYKEVLTEDQFAAFSRLREIRKELAEQEGVPVYAVFTNEQLAEIVRKGARTMVDLASIEGIGESKVTKYGKSILSLDAGDGGAQ